MNEFARKNFVTTEMILAQIIADVLIIFLSAAKAGSPLAVQVCNNAKDLLRSLESMSKLNAEDEFAEWKKVNKKRVRQLENYYSADTLKVLLQDTPIKINDQLINVNEIFKILRTSKSEIIFRLISGFNTNKNI